MAADTGSKTTERLTAAQQKLFDAVASGERVTREKSPPYHWRVRGLGRALPQRTIDAVLAAGLEMRHISNRWESHELAVRNAANG